MRENGMHCGDRVFPNEIMKNMIWYREIRKNKLIIDRFLCFIFLLSEFVVILHLSNGHNYLYFRRFFSFWFHFIFNYPKLDYIFPANWIFNSF